jgi:hypothetical protein
MTDNTTPAAGASPAGSAIVRQWFDQLEVTLKDEARLAGLLGHGSMVGNAREFFVSRVLRSILPPMVHIGSGRVIGGSEAISNQIDVILYDSRFPVLEIQPGVGVYYAEGVIGTVEVKSKLTHKKLADALENCKSVMDLSAHVHSTEALDMLALKLMREDGLSPEAAEDAVHWSLTPRTYIFSFTTEMSAESVRDAVNKWYKTHIGGRTAFYPGLPTIIVTEGVVGLLNDKCMVIDPGEKVRADMLSQFGPDARVVMAFWAAQRQFGWLALRLIHDVNERLGSTRADSGVTLAVDAYAPVRAYHQEDLREEMAHYIVWPPGVAPDGDGQGMS